MELGEPLLLFGADAFIAGFDQGFFCFGPDGGAGSEKAGIFGEIAIWSVRVDLVVDEVTEVADVDEVFGGLGIGS